MQTVVKIGALDVDLAKALPLTLGDVKALIKAGALGADGKPPANAPIEGAIQFITVLARKAEPRITDADIESLPHFELPKLSSILEALLAKDADSPLAK